jgi:hypothetical protein
MIAKAFVVPSRAFVTPANVDTVMGRLPVFAAIDPLAQDAGGTANRRIMVPFTPATGRLSRATM